MAKPHAEDPAEFLARQPKEALVALLLELARDHETVQSRLARLQLADHPDKLAAGFKKTLAAWKRSSKFYSYREAGEFGRTLEGWLDQVERELCRKEPPAALALFQAFIEADASWFERADDSDGVIGDAVRAACQHWLRAAARSETPVSGVGINRPPGVGVYRPVGGLPRSVPRGCRQWVILPQISGCARGLVWSLSGRPSGRGRRAPRARCSRRCGAVCRWSRWPAVGWWRRRDPIRRSRGCW